MAIRWSGNSQLQLPELVDVFKLSRFGAMGGPTICYMFIFLCALDFFALPPQGSHPVPQPVVETVARHLQVVLAGSQKVDVLSCLVFFRRAPEPRVLQKNQVGYTFAHLTLHILTSYICTCYICTSHILTPLICTSRILASYIFTWLKCKFNLLTS